MNFISVLPTVHSVGSTLLFKFYFCPGPLKIEKSFNLSTFQFFITD